MKYIGFYDTEQNRRLMSLAATNKMDYICQAMNSIGWEVEIIACGMIAENTEQVERRELTKHTSVYFFKTFRKSKYKFKNRFNLIRQNLILFFYLLRHVKKDEEILVYHSLSLMRCLYFAKKIIKFKMILEVEEIYNDVILKSNLSRKMEIKFVHVAEKYIFPTKLLNKKLNLARKPYCIIHGTYHVEKDRKAAFYDDKIHVVYAGTLDPRKGSLISVATALFLDSRYHIHILGFGSEKEKEDLRNYISEISCKTACDVTYDGLLSGEAYIRFIQSCHIGLSTQQPDAAFNDTSFPSKVLSYLANGLRVVSIKMKALETSDINDLLYYYEEQKPESIAKAIKGIDFHTPYNSRERIIQLDKKFCKDLKNLIN